MHGFWIGLETRVLLLVSLTLTVFVGTLAYHATSARQVRLGFIRSHLLDEARLIAAHQGQIIEFAQRYLTLLIADEAEHSVVAPEKCQRVLARQLTEAPGIANIYVAHPDGTVVCSATPGNKPVHIADRSYFQQALASPGLVIGDATRGRISGKEVLPFAKAVRDTSGRAIGVYAITLDLEALLTRAVNDSFPAGARIGLVDANGRVLTRHPDPDNWIGRDASDTAFYKTVAARNQEGTFEQVGFDGVQRVYGLARFASTASGPIWLWVGHAKDTVTADIDRDFARTVIALVTLAVLMFAVMWRGSRVLLLRPISALLLATRRMGQGDLSARTGLGHGRDELGALAQSFDEMASALEARSHDVILAGRAVKVLATWNQALLTPRDEVPLIECMCQAIVEAGGYVGAWVGFARDDADKSVEPVAWYGMDPRFVASMRVSWADVPRGRGPTGSAIRGGAANVVNDYMTNPEMAPWRENALRGQINSIISIPLRVEGAVIGALSIHSAEPDSFGKQEAVLLAEVAAALSSGIAAVRARAAHSQLEWSLQTSAERFRAASEASPDALFVFKTVRNGAGNIVDFDITEMNARAAQQIGIPRADAIGKTYMGLLPLYRAKSDLDKYAEVVTTGTRFEEEFAYDVPDKGRRWFRQQVVPVGDGIAISLRDVTTWKRAGDTIREQEERLRLALAAAKMGAWSQDLANGAYTNSEETGPIFGLPKGTGPRSTESLMFAVHPDDREQLAESMKRDREMRQPGHMEFRVLWPDTTVHWVEVHSNVICDGSGTPVRSVGVIADITQRKLDMFALQRANRALKTLSAGNEALVRATSESGLLHEICRVIVGKGGYRMASVAYPRNDQERTIALIAWAGPEDGYLTATRHTWADNEQGQRPIARTLRSGKVEIARNVGDHPAFAPVKVMVTRLGYASNLALPLLDANKVIGGISIYASEADAFDDAEVRLLQELAEDLAYGIVTLRTREERDRIAHAHEHHEAILRKSLEDSIQAIAATVEMRDPYTAGHQQRVADLAVALAREMQLTEEQVHGLHLAGVVHDLGKVSIPAEILAKPGKLTPVEYTLIQGHAQAGYEILKDIDFPWPVATIVRQHHERIDGSGYPQGLRGEDILLESRILAVADVVEAMGSHRPYRPTLGIDVALQEIERGRGAKYDPAVVDACLKLFREERYALAA